MSLAKIEAGLKLLKFTYEKGVEENFFKKNSKQPHLHEKIRLDRLIFLPAYQKAIFPILEKHVGKEDPSPVLEVGCGTGSFSRDLAPNWLRNKIISFDLNPMSLRVLVNGYDQAQVFMGSAYKIPIKDKAVVTPLRCKIC